MPKQNFGASVDVIIIVSNLIILEKKPTETFLVSPKKTFNKI